MVFVIPAQIKLKRDGISKMTLKEFREQTKDLDENSELIFNQSIWTLPYGEMNKDTFCIGSIYAEINQVTKHETIENKLFLKS